MPKMAQELARHSTIDLTMNHYTHLRLHDQAAAVEALPSLLTPSKPKWEALRATGTDSLALSLAPNLHRRLIAEEGGRVRMKAKSPESVSP
jgi:hypothetical protein